MLTLMLMWQHDQPKNHVWIFVEFLHQCQNRARSYLQCAPLNTIGMVNLSNQMTWSHMTLLAGMNEPVHWFLGDKVFRHPTRNECMGWFAQIKHFWTIDNFSYALVDLIRMDVMLKTSHLTILPCRYSCLSRDKSARRPWLNLFTSVKL